jgi:hypothetical protein
MSIHYVLYENKLINVPEGYLARVRNQGSADLEAIIDRIVERDTTVGRVDVVGVLEAYFDAVERFLQEGKSVITPLVILGTSIRGIFESPKDSFDPERHQLAPRATPAKHFHRILRDLAVVKLRSEGPRPWPEEFIDAVSGEKNGAVTPDSPALLTGALLRFDATDPAQGVFFRAADDSVTRVELLVKNSPTELFFNTPALAPGDYRLEVRASFSSNGNGNVRVGVLNATLTVSA